MPAILLHIADCESGENGASGSARQFHKDGTVVESYTADFGKWQINQVNFPQARKMGLDPMTEEGNKQMALYLYERNGTAPWNSSKHCWGSYLKGNLQ